MINKNFQIAKASALIVVDMQEDFLPGGALSISRGDEIILEINEMIAIFKKEHLPIVFTQDWHPSNHKSFASNHVGKNPGDEIHTQGLGPILWPDHCVQGTMGAKITEKIEVTAGTAIIRKGYHTLIDSYSAFFDNDQTTKSGLARYLKDLGITTIYICGLALDYCCYFTAIDAKREGFNVNFLRDLTRGIDNPEGRIKQVINDMISKEIHILGNPIEI